MKRSHEFFRIYIPSHWGDLFLVEEHWRKWECNNQTHRVFLAWAGCGVCRSFVWLRWWLLRWLEHQQNHWVLTIIQITIRNHHMILMWFCFVLLWCFSMIQPIQPYFRSSTRRNCSPGRIWLIWYNWWHLELGRYNVFCHKGRTKNVEEWEVLDTFGKEMAMNVGIQHILAGFEQDRRWDLFEKW